MPTISLERRVAALEAEVARLKEGETANSGARQPWWEEIRGTFKDDAMYDEAMRLGREWREAQHPDEEVDRAS